MTLVDDLWANEEVLTYLRARGLHDDTIAEAELGYVADEQSRYFHSVSIPYFDGRGQHRSTRYRHLRPEMARRHKYESEVGGKAHLYGVEHVREPVVYLTEGEFDSLILRQMELPAVGVPGANGWQRPWRWLFRDCDLVVVCFDVDTPRRKGDGKEFRPGQEGARKVVGQLSSIVSVREIGESSGWPEGHDINSLYLANPDLLWRLLT